MTRNDLEQLSSHELIARFAEICVAQYEPEFDFDTRRFTRLFDQMQAVSVELKKRTGGERRNLTALFDHPNIQVRLKRLFMPWLFAMKRRTKYLKMLPPSRGIPKQQMPAACCGRSTREAMFRGRFQFQPKEAQLLIEEASSTAPHSRYA